MTYVVVENCIKCKYMDCVEVCPVDCFYEGANMLVIHPDECIDCGVCEPECPAEAIKPDTEPGLEKWLELNAEYSKSWPNITVKREGPADGKEWDGVEGKLKYFDPEPGTGIASTLPPGAYFFEVSPGNRQTGACNPRNRQWQARRVIGPRRKRPSSPPRRAAVGQRKLPGAQGAGACPRPSPPAMTGQRVKELTRE